MTIRLRLFSLCLLSLCFIPSTLSAEGKRIALSFDDVPRHSGGFFSPDERTHELIAALDRTGVDQAGFFVTTGNLDKPFGQGGEERIRSYVEAGHVIANHTHSHPWLSRTETDAYLDDLDQAERWLSGREGHRPWFRFPYLDEGKKDLEKRDSVRRALDERGLQNGYVTVDNYDWHLDGLASQARAKDAPMNMKALRDLYVETLLQAANFYDEVALKTLGRSPAHVLLLHETDLAALYIEDLVEAFRADGWEIISMDEAYADPIADIHPDTWFLGGGRVAAIAHTRGWKPAELVHERTDEAVLNELFEQRVLESSLSEF